MFTAVRTWGDTLVETHPETRAPVPSLAESWSPSPDAKTWTFKIRKGVQFHDGKEMTTDDVVATLKRHSDSKTESGAAGVLKSIKSIENKSGDLVVTLDSGNADLPRSSPTTISSSSRTAASTRRMPASAPVPTRSRALSPAFA